MWTRHEARMDEPGRRRFSLRGILTIAGVLVAVLALLIGLNAGGLRDRLFGRLGTPRIEAIAVLPFENASNDPGQEYLANVMTSALTSDLQRITAFRGIALMSVTRYKKAPKPLPEIARELDVDAIVQGTVFRLGDRVRIAATLLQIQPDRKLWEQTYERDLSDIENLGGEIICAIGRAIHSSLSPKEEAILTSHRRISPQAREVYLQGAAAYGKGPAVREKYFEQAIRLDPSYAPAHDILAQMYYMRAMAANLAPRDIFPKTREAAQETVRLDSDARMSHRILGSVALEYDWNYAEAESEFKRALELVPNSDWAHHMYAHFLLSMGRTEEAKKESRRTLELNPRGQEIACVSWHEIAAHDYEAAERRSLEALKLGAPDQLARLVLGWSYSLRGMHDKAIPEFQKAVVGWQNAVYPTAALGHAYAVAGNESAGREVLNKLLARGKTEYVSPYEIAVIYAGLGEKDRAFEWLDKAYEDRSTMLVYFRMDPRIWSLRPDPRFGALLRRMNFPQIDQEDLKSDR